MRTAAIIQDEHIKNVIVFDDASAEGLIAFYGDAFVEITDESPMPGKDLGWTYSDNRWNPYPAPFPSWSWNGQYYEPPVLRPEGVNYEWDEGAQDWIYAGPAKPTIVES